MLFKSMRPRALLEITFSKHWSQTFTVHTVYLCIDHFNLSNRAQHCLREYQRIGFICCPSMLPGTKPDRKVPQEISKFSFCMWFGSGKSWKYFVESLEEIIFTCITKDSKPNCASTSLPNSRLIMYLYVEKHSGSSGGKLHNMRNASFVSIILRERYFSRILSQVLNITISCCLTFLKTNNTATKNTFFYSQKGFCYWPTTVIDIVFVKSSTEVLFTSCALSKYMKKRVIIKGRFTWCFEKMQSDTLSSLAKISAGKKKRYFLGMKRDTLYYMFLWRSQKNLIWANKNSLDMRKIIRFSYMLIG